MNMGQGRLPRLAGIGALAAFLAGPALAADLPIPNVVPPPQTINWTGFYLGGDIGGVFTDATFKRPGIGLQETTVGTIDPRPAFGTYFGFNYQFAPWAVAGIEGDLNHLSTAYYRELGFQFDFLQRTRWVDSVTGRLGLTWRPDTMIYIKGGPAWVNVAGVQGFGTPFWRTLSGVQAGVGIETLVTPNIAVRTEATYTRASVLSLNAGTDLYRPAFLMMQIGASYKFDAPSGWGVPATAAAAPALLKNPILTKAPPKAIAADPPPKWTGFEVGGFVSANGNQIRYRDTVAGELGPYADLRAGAGWFFGGNFQFDRFVIGAEVSENFEHANFQTAAGNGGIVNYYHFAGINRVLAATARAGVLVAPDTLVYAKAGPANLRMTPDPVYFNAIAPNTAVPTIFPGYVAGGGIETYLLPYFSVRAEALYTHSNHKVVLNGVVPNEISLQPSVVSAQLGAALHF
jgi:outer membrane immunogenic protein